MNEEYKRTCITYHKKDFLKNFLLMAICFIFAFDKQNQDVMKLKNMNKKRGDGKHVTNRLFLKTDFHEMALTL